MWSRDWSWDQLGPRPVLSVTTLQLRQCLERWELIVCHGYVLDWAQCRHPFEQSLHFHHVDVSCGYTSAALQGHAH